VFFRCAQFCAHPQLLCVYLLCPPVYLYVGVAAIFANCRDPKRLEADRSIRLVAWAPIPPLRILLTHSGVISLLPDHVIVHPGFVEDSTPLNEQQIAVEVQPDENIVLNGVAGEPSGLAEMCVETEFK